MALNNNKKIDQYLDFLSGIILFFFGAYVLISGIYIAIKSTIGDIVWYGSPGMFPIFIGAIIIFLSILLIIDNYSKDNKKNLLSCIKVSLDKDVVIRTLITVLLFSIYVFILIGHIPFFIATFLYLFVNIWIFRENKFAIWKILIISLIVTSIVCLGFGKIANIPLP